MQLLPPIVAIIVVAVCCLFGATAAAHQLNNGIKHFGLNSDVIQRQPAGRPRRTDWSSLSLLANSGVNATLSVRGSLFQKVVEELLPMIDAIGNNVTIPSDSGNHWSFDTFTLEDFSLGNVTVNFTSPSSVVIGLENLQLTVPHTHFDVWIWIIFKISCSGRFWGSISGASIYLALDFVTEPNGALSIVSVTPTVNFGSLNVNHDFPNFFCKVGQDIIQLFIGNINKKIRNAIEGDLPGTLSNAVFNALTNALSQLTLRFSSQPIAADDTLTLGFELVPPSTSSWGQLRTPNVAHQCGGPLAVGGVFLDRDITIQLNGESMNDLLQDIAASNHLEFNVTLPSSTINTSILAFFFPNAYHACPGCPFSVDVDIQPQYPPTMEFYNNTLMLNIQNAIFGLNAVNTTTNSYDPLFDVFLNTTVVLSDVYVNSIDSRLFFQIAVQDFSFTLDRSILPGIDVVQLGQLLDYLLSSVLVPIFNMAFPGILLNLTKDGFGLEQLRLRADDDVLAIGANVLLPPLT